jgi:hypothetical protein
MIPTRLEVVATGLQVQKNETKWSFAVSNRSDKIAFFVNPQLLSGDMEVAPSFWSSNYFTLAPGETIDLTVGFPSEVVKSGQPNLKISGWNVEEMTVNFMEEIR